MIEQNWHLLVTFMKYVSSETFYKYNFIKFLQWSYKIGVVYIWHTIVYVSGVQHSYSIFIYLIKWSPW